MYDIMPSSGISQHWIASACWGHVWSRSVPDVNAGDEKWHISSVKLAMKLQKLSVATDPDFCSGIMNRLGSTNLEQLKKTVQK